MNAGEDFETKIVVKTNMLEVLQQELRRRSWARERVAIGTATDAYQPCEGRYRLTRRCLEALRDAATPISIVTKSTLILRDWELLTQLAQGPGATVYFTITTLDDALWRLIEPGTPPAHKRLEVMRRLSSEGVRCGSSWRRSCPASQTRLNPSTRWPRRRRPMERHRSARRSLRLAPVVKEHYFGFVESTLRTSYRAMSGPTPGRISSGCTRRRSSGVLPGFGSARGFTDDAMRGRTNDGAT